jgi:hypothetical protein
VGRRRLAALIVMAVAVMVVSALTGHHVALYDGVGFPDEPYRYVQPPKPSLRTAKPPTAASITVDIRKGTNGNPITAASQESGPQVSIYVAPGALHAPSSASKIIAVATPKAPYATKPQGYSIAGDIYHFSASTKVGPVRFASASYNEDTSTIDLRLPQGFAPGASIAYRKKAGEPWTALVTYRIGNDIYEAPLIGFGDYAMVKKSGTQSSHHSGYRHILMISLLAVSVFVVVAIIIVIRYRARRGKPDGNTKLR